MCPIIPNKKKVLTIEKTGVLKRNRPGLLEDRIFGSQPTAHADLFIHLLPPFYSLPLFRAIISVSVKLILNQEFTSNAEIAVAK
jgi:hypothetical protein